MIYSSVQVLCRNSQCEHSGKIRVVRLDAVAVGVLALPQFLCTGCGMIMATPAQEDL